MTMRHNGYDDGTIRHEGIHICQTSHTSPNFKYDGDSMWYWEASASWYGFMGSHNISDDLHTWGPAIEMGATIVANPQLALWHSFSNGVSSQRSECLQKSKLVLLRLLMTPKLLS